ncbi:hypothetical protein I5M32_11295 [Pedobacter sp. SD-b]|uniref:Uncharacterized protein n=1 Tax=Pedobacter segetis TaxID=2793069 RepID=A0ABS1BKY9_9SPHI|nr:hypothetical protein [Pedobacter segetis]MBK0383542.1 hypothetical protein [Pedobacter segetis]
MPKEPKATENTINLLDILSEKVEVKDNPAVFNIDVSEENFRPEFEEEIIEDLDEKEDQGQLIDDSEYSDEPMYLNPKDTAESIVGCIDGLQAFGLPIFLKKSVFTAKELEMLDTLDTTGGTIYRENSPEKKILNRYNKYLSIVDQFPFSEGEKRRLVDGTARYVKVTNLKMSPLTGLMLAFGDVTAKRISLFNSID